MAIKIVTDRAEIDRLFEAKVTHDRSENELWFRDAITVEAKPLCVLVNDSAIFMWETDTFFELWGGFFLDMQVWPFARDETKEFCEWLKPSTNLDVFTNMDAFDYAKGYASIVDPSIVVNELKIPWSSWDECNHSQRNGKRRADLRKHIDRYEHTVVSKVVGEITSDQLDKLIEWSRDTVETDEEWSYSSTLIVEGLRSLLAAASAMGAMSFIRMTDNEAFVGGAVVFRSHGYANLVLLHSDKDRYPWLGKRLYKEVIEMCITNKDRVISGGCGLSGLKLMFRFEEKSSWRIWIK